MSESILTISIAGLVAGFVLSMPIAGPISILITTNALKGRAHYCNRVNIGASFGTFIYVFFVTYGLTKLYPYYKPAIPYLLSLGSLFLLFIGSRIFNTKLDIEHIEDTSQLSVKVRKQQKGGLYTGFVINFFNPTLIIGWLTSTFFVISFVSSLGFNTGNLDIAINQSIKEMSNIESSITDEINDITSNGIGVIKAPVVESSKQNPAGFPKYFHLFISIVYALFISAGCITWFYLLTLLLTRFRKKINVRFLSLFIKGLGVVICFFGLYFGYLAVRMLLALS
jgi:threonine/homoserine/homoserine lactone efflux protein